MCLAQVFLGSLLRTGQPRPQGAFPLLWRWFKARVKRPGNEVGDGLVNYWPFSSVPSNSPRPLCESLFGSLSSFFKWRMGKKSKHQYNLTPHLGRSGHCNLAEVESWALLDQSQPSIQLPEQLCRTATFNKPSIIRGNALSKATARSIKIRNVLHILVYYQPRYALN